MNLDDDLRAEDVALVRDHLALFLLPRALLRGRGLTIRAMEDSPDDYA